MANARISQQLWIMDKQDKPGILAKLTKAIDEMGVNIEALCAYVYEGEPNFLLVTSDNESTKEALVANGFACQEMEVILVELSDKPGSLDNISQKLAAAGINLKLIYATAAGANSLVVLQADDNAKALSVINTP